MRYIPGVVLVVAVMAASYAVGWERGFSAHKNSVIVSNVRGIIDCNDGAITIANIDVSGDWNGNYRLFSFDENSCDRKKQ